MKIAVLGSNSFSGSHFVNFALGRGAEVIGISRSPEPHPVFLPYRWSGREAGFRFHAFDLNRDLDTIMALLVAERPQFVVNYAAQSMVAESWRHPEHWFQTNVVSTIKLHDRLRQCDFLDRYVHISTPEVYGSTEGFVREDHPFNPTTPYAVSRAAADMSLAAFFSAYGFPAVITRAANVYGPGQRLYRLIPRAMLFIRLGRKLALHGGGRSRRSFIHIDDVSDATWRVMTEGRPGGTYHVSTPETVTVRQIVERICAMTGTAFADAVETAEERKGQDAAYELDTGKIRNELGWADRVDPETGLHSCLEWVDANLDTLAGQDLDYIHKP